MSNRNHGGHSGPGGPHDFQSAAVLGDRPQPDASAVKLSVQIQFADGGNVVVESGIRQNRSGDADKAAALLGAAFEEILATVRAHYASRKATR